MSNFRFVPSDFAFDDFVETITSEIAAARAQEVLEKWLDGQKVVYAKGGLGSNLSFSNDGSFTHQALLVNVVPIPKSECEHRNVEFNVQPKEFALFHSKLKWKPDSSLGLCIDCGIRVKPKSWEPA